MVFARLKRGDHVIIVGAGGFAIELAELVCDIGARVCGCIGPEAPIKTSGLEYLGGDDVIKRFLNFPMLVAIGRPDRRREVFGRIAAAGGWIAGFIHPAAYVSPKATIGGGALVYPNATIHAGVILGCGVLVNSNATIGHETSVGEFVNIGPGVSLGGKVHVGDEVYIGIGACTIEGVKIATGSILGAGTVVVKDCIPAGTYMGVPARRKK